MHNGIRLRVLLIALVPVIIIFLMLGIYMITTEINTLKHNQQEKALNLINHLAIESEFLVALNDSDAILNLIKNELNQEITGIILYNQNTNILAKIGDITLANPKFTKSLQTIPQKNSTILMLPIKITKLTSEVYSYVTNFIRKSLPNTTIVGWIAIEINNSIINNKIFYVLLHSLAIMGISLGISCFFALKLSNKMVTPILAIITAMRKIEQGNLNIKLTTNAPGELAILESGLNTMVTALNNAHDELQYNIDQATSDLRHTLETIEIQNIELELSRKEAVKASKIKSEFLASMSHELRTPLNGIIGFINILLQTELNVRQYDYLLTIKKSSNTLLSIINNILDFSKLEAGKLYLDLEPIDIRDCIEDTLTLLAPSAHEKAIELVPLFYPEIPNLILGDALRLRQILTNLVSNSIKFTEHGSVIVRVQLEQTLANDRVILRISVEDTGKGLTEKQQKELFHSFTQLDPKITKQFGGTGLGLVICKSLIEQMNGQINIDSTPQQGSTFWFTIEVQKVSSPINNAMSPQNQIAGFKILFFEQHPITSITIKNMLDNWNIIWQQVDNLENIIPYLIEDNKQQVPWQLILIGLNQLGAEQSILATILELNNKNKAIPIIILINTTEYFLHNKTLMQKFSLCLTKPICRAKLYEALANTLITPTQQNINNNLLQQPINVLAVDDNIANLKLITTILENMNIPVTIATSAAEALTHTQNTKFALILMDIHMPEMDGIEASQLIRKSASCNQDTPIIALSAHIDLQQKINMQNFINDYLTKPINEQQLKASIHKWTCQNIILDHSLTQQNIPPTKLATSNAISTPSELQSTDWNLGVTLTAGNEELAKDLFTMLINELPNTQELINTAYKNHDIKAFKDHVHKLHGGCCYVGVPKLKYLAKTLEMAAIKQDWATINLLIIELNQEFTLLPHISFNKTK